MELQGDNFNLQPGLTGRTLGFQLCPVEWIVSVACQSIWTIQRQGELVVISVGYTAGYSVPRGLRGGIYYRSCSATDASRMDMNIVMSDVAASPGVLINDEVDSVEALSSLEISDNYVFLTPLVPTTTGEFF